MKQDGPSVLRIGYERSILAVPSLCRPKFCTDPADSPTSARCGSTESKDASFDRFCNPDECRNLWTALPSRIGWNRPLPSGGWARTILRIVIPSGGGVSVPFLPLKSLSNPLNLQTRKSLIRLMSWREGENSLPSFFARALMIRNRHSSALPNCLFCLRSNALLIGRTFRSAEETVFSRQLL